MKPYVEERGDHVVVYFDRGHMTVTPDGECTIWVDIGGTLQWATAGVFAWDRGVIEDCPGCLSEDLYVALEETLDRWARSADGRDWLRRHVEQ
jgi:hypothetical protein